MSKQASEAAMKYFVLGALASGMLPVALGEATKTVPFVMDGRKLYRFTVAWGEQIFCGGYRRRCRPERSEGPPHGVTAARNRYCVVSDPAG